MSIEILIVEDSAVQAEMLRRLLVKEGYEVFVAKDGAEGLEIVKKHCPALIISDIKMPEYFIENQGSVNLHDKLTPSMKGSSHRYACGCCRGSIEGSSGSKFFNSSLKRYCIFISHRGRIGA